MIYLACENIRFSSLFVAEDVSRGNVLSDEERGETDVFAGYDITWKIKTLEIECLCLFIDIILSEVIFSASQW